jgi:hypothetical protein
MAIDKRPKNDSNAARYAIIGVLALAAFFGAYKFASAGSASGSGSTAQTVAGTQAAAGTQGAESGGGCACCGGAATAQAAPVEGRPTVSGGVQRINVDVKLQYSPNVLRLKAGVPAAITFSAAQGCTGIVQSQDLGFQEDLTTGAKTVQFKSLKPGTYGFACGMNMVHGLIVVE